MVSPMIHHLSIPARDPEHVARVLAELFRRLCRAIHRPDPGRLGGLPGGWLRQRHRGLRRADDALVPGEGDTMGTTRLGEPPQAVAFHALISVKADRATIEHIGAREGWRTQHFWRGPPSARLFELYEFWVENRVMLELATEDMLPPYVKIANGPAQRALLAAGKAGHQA